MSEAVHLNLRGLEVTYDYNIPEYDYIITFPWKFWRFVSTYLGKISRSGLMIEQVADSLERLNETKVIEKLYPDYL